MTRPVPPVSPTPQKRRLGRRLTDPSVLFDKDDAAPPAGTNLPVVAGPLSAREDLALGAVDAQILGQDGVKRGLRGGKPVLDQARSAYLGTEYSGAADRRPSPGLIKKTEL